jgi:hypothetical protein
MIELSKSLVGIKILLENIDIKNYFFTFENNFTSINIEYDDTIDQFNFFVQELFYQDSNFIDIKYSEESLDPKEDIFDKKFDLSHKQKLTYYQDYSDDVFKKKNLLKYNFNRNLQITNKLFGAKITSNLFKLNNGNIDTSLDLKGSINSINYFVNVDNQDNMILSLNYDNIFGIGISKNEDYNLLNIFNNYNRNDENMIKFSYSYYDRKTEFNHEPSLIYFNKNLNYKFGSSFITKNMLEISEVAIGFKVEDCKEINNLEINYSYDLQNDKPDIEGIINLSLKDIISSNYFNYFNQNFNILSSFKRYQK